MEWLEADGRGGYAMGTADTIRTRRYHAILCAATPATRMVLVADLEVFVETAAGRFALSSHRYRNEVIYPDGASRLVRFVDEPWPRWEWALPDGTRIACELAMHGPRACLRWTGAGTLTVRPLLAGRDYHACHHENGAFRFDAEVTAPRVTWRPYDGVPAIHASGNGRYTHAPDWYRSFLLVDERERGLDHEEDLATPGSFTFDLARPAMLAFSTEGGAFDIERAFELERTRRAAFPSQLLRAADAYVVGDTIMAGYPWFSDWGRDTFISLRGLCLAAGRRDEAAAILRHWSHAVSEGMLPNRYVAEAPEYNTVDAALWFVIAAHEAGMTAELRPAIEAILSGYERGTRHGIRADHDGLLACGEPGIQLTWMDAKVGDEVITPRTGKPVEVQALWLNALWIAGRRDLFERGKKSFERFWNAGQLHDVIDVDHVAGRVDPSCRPNQLFAVGGLPLPLVEGERARSIVEIVERMLLTPVGPRSLAPDDPRYRGRYLGGPVERDRSYHNGPVWPWLMGAFVEAWVRVHGGSDDTKQVARTRFLDPLLARAQHGHLAEIYEGDLPHRAVGCPFQAWSVGEALRLDRDVLR